MKLGLFGINMGASSGPQELVAAARAAEAARFESVWAEHVVLPDPQVPPSPMAPQGPALDPLLALAWAGTHTSTLLLATGIVIVPMIVELDTTVDELMAPFDEAATRLLSIPGVGKRTAETIVAEIGVDMTRFPSPAHVASWVGLCPGNNESAGKHRSGKAPKGNEALRIAMREAACAASHTRDTYLAAQYRRFKRRMGTKSEGKAIFAVAHTMIVIVWHLLADNTTYAGLGADYFDKRNDTAARQRYLIRELEKLGNTVTLQPAA